MRQEHSARAVSPGEVLAAELDARGWSQRDLAEIMRRPHQAINEIIKSTKQITPETALELAEAFGTSSDFWVNLESNYRLALAERQQDKNKEIAKRSKLFSVAPVRELIRRGWIKTTKNIAELEKEIYRFLDISSLNELPDVPQLAYRHAEEKRPLQAAEISWIKRVEQLVSNQKVGQFSIEDFMKTIPQLMNLAQRTEDVRNVPSLLLDAGVHFVIVPHLPKTYLDGATWPFEKKPVIALTARYDRIDSFWFTLMHEIAHIMNRHSGLFLDDLYSDDPKDDIEKVADSDACKWLIDQEKLNNFIRTTSRGSKVISRAAILHFARELKRHPGILVGQLHFRKTLDYRHHRGLLSRFKVLLADWIDQSGPTKTSRT